MLNQKNESQVFQEHFKSPSSHLTPSPGVNGSGAAPLTAPDQRVRHRFTKLPANSERNWMKNSLKISNTGLHDEVWDIISAADNAPETKQPTKENKDPAADVRVVANGTENQDHQPKNEEKKKLNKRERKEARQQKNGKAVKGDKKPFAPDPEKDETGKKKKGRKRKHEETGDEEQNEKSVKLQIDESAEVSDVLMSEEPEDRAAPQGKFNWKGNIKAVLRNSPEQELSVKKLRKKIMAAYYTFTGDRNLKTQEEVLALFNKKINKNPKLRVLKDRVKLLK